MSWKLIATVLFKLLNLWLKFRKKKQAAEAIELTTAQQKLHGAAINAINKAERSARNKLDSLDSLRERAESINQFKNSDV